MAILGGVIFSSGVYIMLMVNNDLKILGLIPLMAGVFLYGEIRFKEGKEREQRKAKEGE